MALPLKRPAVGESLPVHPTFQADETARRFWRASFRCARGFLTSPDAAGAPVLVPHEREEADSYKRRVRVTKARNFVGPILRRYNDLVFRKPPVRPGDAVPPQYVDTVQDATGAGESLDAFMRRALIMAQIDREAWILCDVKNPPATVPAMPATVAQVQAAGSRPMLSIIDASSVPNWCEDRGTIVEVWAILIDAAGVPVCRMFTARDYVDAVLDPVQFQSGTWTVKEYRSPVAHNYGGVPMVRLRPQFDPLGDLAGSEGDSQAGPLAESQQAIVNFLSLVGEEIYNVTFSQMVAFGVSDAQVGDAKVGNNRIICVPNPAGSVSMIGADPRQADSIRAQIADEIANLFRLAGVNPADASTAPASGLALAFRHNDLATIVAALAMACEEAEAQVWRLLANAWGFEAPAATQFQGKDTELPDFAGEAATLLAIVANAAVPPTIRRKVAERFAARNLSLDETEQAALATEIERGGSLARALSGEGDGGGAFPLRRGPPRAAAADDDEGGEGEEGGDRG